MDFEPGIDQRRVERVPDGRRFRCLFEQRPANQTDADDEGATDLDELATAERRAVNVDAVLGMNGH